MGDLSENFSRHEFACNCGCGFDTVDHRLLYLLEQVREWFGRPVTITSGCRCSTYNRHPRVRGARNSQHLRGRAADIVVQGISTGRVYEFLTREYPGRYGIARYAKKGIVHVDTRSEGWWRQGE